MELAPSKVLHVRDLAPTTEANDLRQFSASFGDVVYVVMLPKYRQALVEMREISQAAAVIEYAKTTPVAIRGSPVLFSFSKSQEIKRADPPPPTETTIEHHGEHILLLTIVNPLYPIDVTVLHTIMSPYGKVVRIVIFTKNGTQALVEFDNPASAAQARQLLDGKDIYEGCCTLRITFSRADRLNVRNNNDKTYDFTDPTLPAGDPQPFQSAILPAAPTTGGPPMQTSVAGAVLMVYNLPETGLTCDMVFNLFSLYGNVSRVKLLASKPGSAMVQMFEKTQSDQAMSHLNRLMLAGKEISVTFSKHPYIADNHCVFVDHNGDTSDSDPHPACKDYTNSPCNRFIRQGAPVQFKHLYRPTAVLFFSNVSPNTVEEDLRKHMNSFPTPGPKRLKMFQNESVKKQGLLEYATVEDAVMAVMHANNTRLDGYTIKLSFSSNTL